MGDFQIILLVYYEYQIISKTWSSITMMAIITILLIGTARCMDCGTFCSWCTSQGCATCMYPNMFILNGVCKNCSQGCSTCTNASTCFSCKPGYYLSDGACSSCGEGCLTCVDHLGCTNCPRTEGGCAPPAEMQQDSMKLGIILGSTFGGVALTAFLIALIYKKLKKLGPYPRQQSAAATQQSLQKAAASMQRELEWKKFDKEKNVSNEECSICQATETNVITSCKHVYHHVCLSQWLQHHNTCPLCRKLGIFEIRVICLKCKLSYFDKNINDVVMAFGKGNSFCPRCRD